MMTQIFQIEGMTCNHCVTRVKEALLKHQDVVQAEVTLNPSRAMVTLKQPVSIERLQQLIQEVGHYSINKN